MISLIITLFICLFTFCPSISQVEDHQVNNDIYLVNTAPVKNFGYYDEYGIQLYMFDTDFKSGEFILTFLSGVSGENGSPNSWIGLSSSQTGNIDLEVSGHIYSCSQGYVNRDVNLANIRAVRLEKLSYNEYNVDNEPFVLVRYRFSLIYGYDFYYRVEYTIAAPLLNEFQHDLSVDCISSTIIVDAGSAAAWCYFENTLETDYTPLINYYYRVREQRRIDLYNSNYNAGYDYGRQIGYAEGRQSVLDTNSTASVIFEGIFEVGLLPVNVFLTIFNFEVFGINIAGIVSGLLTIAVVVIIVRLLLGGKKDD